MVIKQVRIIDPADNRDEIGDLYIHENKIARDPVDTGGPVIDGRGLTAFPGLIDLHVHLRDPGMLHKEDIYTGTMAAAAGGFTSVACMPNTRPLLDTPETIAYVNERAKTAHARVFPIGAVTVGQKGKSLTDFAALKSAGIVALSDDGEPIDSAALLRRALQTAKPLALPVMNHCEDREMVQNHGVNEGIVAEKLGLSGRPAVAEVIQVARDILLAQDTGAQLHFCHISAAGSVELIRRAKADGIPVTAETCPQYFTLTEDALLELGALARVNPPLRTAADRDAIIAGLIDGTLDTIVTDHAPHAMEDKALPIPQAQSGMIGLETALCLALTFLYHTDKLDLLSIARLMSYNPARILGLPYGTLQPGSPADITLFDPHETWTVEPEKFYSKSRNTPFGGMMLRGRVRYTICDGVVRYGVER